MANEMVERVARAICIEQGFAPDDKYRSSSHEGCEPREFQWHAFQPEARAAIAAMREPTDEMLRAGYTASGGIDEQLTPDDVRYLRAVYCHMIDKALEEA